MKLILKTKKLDPHKSILIFSHPRSGSTWLLELFGQLTGVILNFEPIHSKNGPIREINQICSPFSLQEDSQFNLNRTFYSKVFQDIISLKKYNQWSLSRTDLRQIKNGTRVVTKFINCNGMIPWILENIVLEHKPVILLRHPIATCNSLMKAFHKKPIDVNEIIENIMIYCDTEEQKKLLASLKTSLEVECFKWCLAHYSLLSGQIKASSYTMIFYEDLILHPKRTFGQLMLEYGLRVHDSLIDFRRASTTDFQQELKEDPRAQIGKHHKKYAKSDLDRIQSIFDCFDQNFYSAYDLYPLSKKTS